jgi:hypothetical protein
MRVIKNYEPLKSNDKKHFLFVACFFLVWGLVFSLSLYFEV